MQKEEYINRKNDMISYLQEYLLNRSTTKKKYIDHHFEELLSPFSEKLDELIHMQLELQKEGRQEKIRTICFFRLLTSGYTGSNEMAIGMSNSKLYMDKNISYVYWKPELIYKSIDMDMKEAEQQLRKKFIRLEEYELFSVKQKLLSDDWKVFCKIIEKVFYEIAPQICESGLAMEKKVHVLCGNYRNRLNTVCYINTEKGEIYGQ